MRKITSFLVLGCILSSCATYKASMSDASNNPLPQKLPKMKIEWVPVQVNGINEAFVKNIINNEINNNIISSNGPSVGTIEVRGEQMKLRQNLLLPLLSGFSLFYWNLLGLPITTTKVEMTLCFNILNDDGAIIDTYRYSASRKKPAALYYGEDSNVCAVIVTKEIMERFRNDLKNRSNVLIAQLGGTAPISPTVYAQNTPTPAQPPVAVGQPVTVPPAVTQTDNVGAAAPGVFKSDVDINIPVAKTSNDNTFALIIANENYEFVDNVQFALNDGEVFREYCIKTLGIPERQVWCYKDASLGIISGGIDKMVQAMSIFEDAKAIVYYCGHGIPDEKTGDAYIIPVDGRGTNTATCYSLNQLYKTMSSAAKSNVTYFMDACFTGANREGSMLVAARGVAREAKKEVIEGNTVVFSAASGDETAMPFKEKNHGMFTYFLLKKLQESHGEVKYGELAEYIRTNVRKESFLTNEKLQNPYVATSVANEKNWRNESLK